MSQLVGQREEAGGIVYRWFRFRVRRGLGVLYSLLSTMPVLGNILGAVGLPQSIVIPCVTIAIVLAWVVARTSGLEGFGRMASTIVLLKGSERRSRFGTGALLFGVIAFWPWLAFATAAYYGQTLLELLFAVVWLLELVAYRVLSLRRNKDPIVDHTLEDWLVIVSIPLAALVSTFHVFPGGGNFYGFLFVSPILLFSGLKSLYDAPKELATDLDSKRE